MDKNENVQRLCIWCNQPFDTETEPYINGHKTCGDNYENELNRRYDQELIDDCPPGTRFDLAGGAACD